MLKLSSVQILGIGSCSFSLSVVAFILELPLWVYPLNIVFAVIAIFGWSKILGVGQAPLHPKALLVSAISAVALLAWAVFLA